MLQEERVVGNITAASDANKNKMDFSDILARQQTIEMFASRFKLKGGWVDGKHCVVSKRRLPIHWDSELQIWKYGTMSQMMEKQATGKEVCVFAKMVR